MKLVTILTHPRRESLSRGLAEQLVKGFESQAGQVGEVVDLNEEGFDPKFSSADLDHLYLGHAIPPDVAREQARIDSADALAFVFPVYWWSMPALLKGWIDRVFTNGFAFQISTEGKIEGRLRERPIHILALAAGDLDGYEKYEYKSAINTQIVEGVFRFCGVNSVQMHLLYESQSTKAEIQRKYLDDAYAIGRSMLENH